MATPRPAVSYEVRVWKVAKVVGKKGTAYRLRWMVAGRRHSRTFTTAAMADSKRSELVSAMRDGEPFDMASGLPVSRIRAAEKPLTWWEWALEFVDAKWDHLAPTSRRSTADELVPITAALTATGRGMPPAALLRSAMFRWAFNSTARKAGPPPDDLAVAISWLEAHSERLDALEDRDLVREVLGALTRRLDGKPAAGTTIARRRNVFHSALEMAVERGHLESNPLDRVRWKPPRTVEAVDPRAVANPEQARALLAAVATPRIDSQSKTNRGPAPGVRFTAFFASMYYSALRPSEAAELSTQDLDIPAEGWGWLLISRSNAEVSNGWSDDGKRRPRQLKHRPPGEVRRVPCPPPLTQLLHEHVTIFGAHPSGRMFRGPYGGQISAKSYTKVWAATRRRALTPELAASPLVRRPYDLRHSAVSTWIAAGVDSAQVAAWAGHSIAVLHRVYAHVLSGREELAQRRIERILGCS